MNTIYGIIELVQYLDEFIATLILIDNVLSTKEVHDGVKQSVVGAAEASLLSCMTDNIEGVGAAFDGLEAGHLAMVHCQGEYILLSH
jgi:hypothetical protein